MNRYTYRYRVFEDADDDYYEYSCLSHPNMPYERIAEDCASHYWAEHDGWDAEWPRNFEIRLGDELLGTFNVHLSADPVFEATKGDPL